MRYGADVPGRITQIPGGVAMNIAMTLRRLGMAPALLSAIGQDVEGAALDLACQNMGLITDYIYRPKDLPTDKYMAIECSGGLVAAIADAHSLEAAGAKILEPLISGPLGTADTPWENRIVLDGNLTEALLADIASSQAFAKADISLAPASPGKATRLLPFLGHPRVTLYVNLEEAGLLLKSAPQTSQEAAEALCQKGAARAIVTNGAHSTCIATSKQVFSLTPPQVELVRVTGAGDTFMAAHIAAEWRGETGEVALEQALKVAADFVSGAFQE